VVLFGNSEIVSHAVLVSSRYALGAFGLIGLICGFSYHSVTVSSFFASELRFQLRDDLVLFLHVRFSGFMIGFFCRKVHDKDTTCGKSCFAKVL
jgi:hypothetical protein